MTNRANQNWPDDLTAEIAAMPKIESPEYAEIRCSCDICDSWRDVIIVNGTAVCWKCRDWEIKHNRA